jgi:hypothetical protein
VRFAATLLVVPNSRQGEASRISPLTPIGESRVAPMPSSPPRSPRNRAFPAWSNIRRDLLQNIGDCERCLCDAFVVGERESSELIAGAVADAVAGREGLQRITDQGTPYLSEAMIVAALVADAHLDRLAHVPRSGTRAGASVPRVSRAGARCRDAIAGHPGCKPVHRGGIS